MSTFENVTVVKKANVYFDGRVTSRTIRFADNTEKTLGFMLPGEYRFGTDAPEEMEIMEGEVRILLPGEKEWQEIGSGQSFSLPGSSQFRIEVISPTDYCCSYLK